MSHLFNNKHIDDVEIPAISACFYKDTKYNDGRLKKIFLFYRYLSQHKGFTKISSEQKHNIVENLEKSCYRNTIAKARKQNINCSWDEEDFEFIYHVTCGKTLAHISRDDAIVSANNVDKLGYIVSEMNLNTSNPNKSTNDFLKNVNKFINLLIEDSSETNEMSKKFPNMTQKELYPEHYTDALKRQTADRQIVIKSSKLRTCPRCKQKQSTVKNRYNRSLDEGVNQIATCYFCGCEWCC